MTFGIIPESDSKGRAVCQFWLQGGKHNVTPTDKITFCPSSTQDARLNIGDNNVELSQDS